MKKITVFEITLCSVMSALSIVLEKFFSIELTNSLKLTIYGLPLMIVGITFGTKIGFITGIISGIVMQLTSKWGISLTSPFWALAPIAWGGISGLIYSLTKKGNDWFRIVLVVIITSLFATLLNTLAMIMETILIRDSWYTISAILIDLPPRLLSMIILVVPYCLLLKLINFSLSSFTKEKEELDIDVIEKEKNYYKNNY